MMTRRYSAAALAAVAAFAWADVAGAASAVAINPVTNQYAWHATGTVIDAEAQAIATCEAQSGSRCLLYDACGLPGPAAIAFNRESGQWGAACGGPDAATVGEAALDTCSLLSKGKGTCTVLERYVDGEPDAGIAQSYFTRSRWAADCKNSTSWYTFEPVNAATVQLEKCTSDGCELKDQVFRPLVGEAVFIWPTDKTRLLKRGPDRLEMTQVNTEFLDRCPKQ